MPGAPPGSPAREVFYPPTPPRPFPHRTAEARSCRVLRTLPTEPKDQRGAEESFPPCIGVRLN